ncbi:helix-turn-helix transcriptional regulator [Streptomyces albus subsp. chlorinus]|uniref:helix-turn-helix domain-containing protein n=1 Tax=Streptomyces albus TaxID=1888 RepID=UPI00156ED322|nr:helix-turn-helix transcriptional regulator [Streptomyces albus]NSC21991.1 helix-turn-helix transcriptional regulator [Streptomyces albus subsp. chlorinus]
MPPKKRHKNASALKMVGQLLANYRRAAGYTQQSLATTLCLDEETIASIEQGRRPLKSDLAEQLDEVLDTKGSLAVAVANLPEYDKYPLWAEEFIDREKEAVSIDWFENQVLPGLLQTEDYARAVFRSKEPPLDADDLDIQVAARLDRQDILQRKCPPSASFVISEAVLLDRLGGDAVRREQLRRLRRDAELPGLSLQIMPLGRETHAALSGPFILLETPDHEHLAYVETQRGSMLVSEANEVSILARKYAMLRTQALNSEESRSLLDRLLGEA